MTRRRNVAEEAENGDGTEKSKHKPSKAVKLTPLEEQVVQLQKAHPDVLLMVEVGYKYRFFGKDAETASQVLGIYNHYDHSFLTASIPTFRLHVHVRRLVKAGYKVGVVRQTENAALKAHGDNKGGPFLRELSAVYTAATLEAVEHLGGSSSAAVGVSESLSLTNYLICVIEEEINLWTETRKRTTVLKTAAVAVEVSTVRMPYFDLRKR